MKNATSRAAARAINLSPDLLVDLQGAAALPDNQIDTSDPDAPEVRDWSGSVRGRFFPPDDTQAPQS